MALGDISNPMVADIAGALSYRDAQLEKAEQKRKELRTRQLISEAIPSLPEGHPIRELMLNDPNKGAAVAQALGIPLNRGDQMAKFSSDVAALSRLSDGDPHAAYEQAKQMQAEYKKIGMPTGQLDKWVGMIDQSIQNNDNQTFTAAFNALHVMNGALNPAKADVISAKDKAELALKEKELNWKMSRPAGEHDGGDTAAERNMARYEQMVKSGDPNAERFAYMVGLSGRDVESKVDLAGRQATAETTGKAQAERRDLFKTQGLAAAENLPTLNRALELQKQISTGGAASNIKGLQNYLGVASADAGELNSLFAQNILGQLKSTFGGSPTEGEREALAQAQSSFSQTGSINERLLNNALKLANERVARGRRAAQADGDDGTIAEFDSLRDLSFGVEKKQSEKNTASGKSTNVGRFKVEVH